MNEVKHWTVSVDIDEHDGRTRALARLQTRDTRSLTGVGCARLHPADHDVPEIGDELAVARALGDLAHSLLGAAADDLEAASHPGRPLAR
ncbi:MAG: DUF1876 domain-containing protein [Pseudonocardia sp.]|nr:DUF1876 domain-containing protein [Pseudonocardia sp.]